MKRRLSLLIFSTILFILAGCGPVTRVPEVTPTSSPEPVVPVVEVQADQVGPFLVAQTPGRGQRLELAPSLQFSFDREMDPGKTAAAFTFLDTDRQSVPGQLDWINAKTLRFKPEGKLNPSSIYQAVFSTAAAGQDGKPLQDEIKLDFTTVDSLLVGQVFPIDRSEEVDGNTNLTVIFNHPVVPLKIKEEQINLPQPLKFSPEVAGQGEWVSSSVYVFQPQQPLLSGVNYKVEVAAGLKDTTGNALGKSFIWNFSTRAPLIGGWALKNGAQNPPETIQNVLLDQAFLVTFLQPMDSESARDHVTLLNRETHQAFPTRLTWNEDSTVLTIEPVGRYQIASFYDLMISNKLRAQDGGTLKDGLTIKFGTVPLPQAIKFYPEPNSEAKLFDARLSIQFASPMKLDSLKNKIRITPQPKQELQWYFNDSNWELNVYGLEPATEYVVRILPGMSDLYGNTIRAEYSYTFRTGDVRPYARLVLPWQPLVYRAKGPQEVFFEQTNLETATISVYPIGLNEFNRVLTGNLDATLFTPKAAPLREWEGVMEDAVRNQVDSVNFKLEDSNGHPLPPGFYFIGVKGKPLEYTGRFYQGFLFIVATDNITLKTSASEASAWIVDLEGGTPQSGLAVSFYDQYFQKLGQATTDKDGLAYLKGIKQPLYAQLDDPNHFAFTAMDWGSGVWAGDFGLFEGYYGETAAPFAYLYTDRPLYRPGQDVFFKGIFRQNDDLRYSLPKEEKVYVTIEHFGEKVSGDWMPLSKMGTFDGKFRLGEEAGLGSYDVYVRKTPATDAFGYLSFRVAEYHKPEFEVLASANPSAILAGEKVTFGLDAKYYSGGNAGNANAEWFLESTPYYFQAAQQFWQFNFSDWDHDIYWAPQHAGGSGTLAEGQTTTDASGHLEVTQTLGLDENKTSQQVTFRANITDAAGNIVSGSTSVVVHQSQVYGGVRSLSYVGRQGEDQPFEIVALDWDSKPVAEQNVSVRFVERRWFSVQSQDKQGQLHWETSVKEIPVSTASAVTGADGKAQVSFVPPRGGVYKAILTVRDAKGHSQTSSAYMWVSSNDYVAWRQSNDRTFSLIADKDAYSPGDTAEILIAQPFEHEAYALVTYERGHIYKQNVVLLQGNSTIYKLPITEEMAPISYVSVVVVSGAEQSGTPDFKIGMTSLKVDTSHQELDVKVTADKTTAGPNDEVTYTIETRDYSGKPVSADVSLAVVDKAALALAPSNSSPILDSFYPDQALGIRTALGIVLNAEDYNAQYRESTPTGGGMGGGGGGDSLGIITVRQNFKDTAFFRGQVTTDENGRAQLTVTLPENLTTWEADARAVTADSRVGQTTGELVSTKPLFIQMQTPRFFVDGDRAQVGAIVHNNEDRAMSVDVSLEAKGVDLLSDAAQTVEVAAGSQAYVTWDLTVQPGVERADFTAHAASGPYEDASKPALGTLSDQGLPVYNYRVTETVGTSGMIQEANSSTEAIQLPQTLDASEAQLSIEMSPSLAASMQSGLTYLEDYPYLCMEQTVSRFLPNVITSRALQDAGIKSVMLQSQLDLQVQTALQRIYAKQHYDGGWNWWDGEQSDPQTSAYVVYGLIEAKESGYEVSESVLARGFSFLRDNVPSLKRNDATWQYNRTAFMLYVLGRGNQLQASQVNFIYEHRPSLSLYGKAYLAQALYSLDPEDARIHSLISDLEAATVLSAAGAHWEEVTHDYWNWNTDTRTTAIVLNAFVQIEPKSPVTAQAVRWLMAHRESGHWVTTQETAWSLIALTNWMKSAGEYDTNYAYAIGLNGTTLEQGEATQANLTKTVDLTVEMKDLLKQAANYLVFSRGDGTGNLYYSAYLSAALPVEQVEPLDQGVSLSRQYFRLDDPKTPITQIGRGELVRVRLTAVLPSSMHYLVIDDPLPAGLEAVDASLLTDTAVPSSYTLTDYEERGWGWWYFTHTELRDEKVVLSADYLPAGTYVFTYLARASTAGTFKVIPPTASEFYFPDVGGRGAGSLFEVTP